MSQHDFFLELWHKLEQAWAELGQAQHRLGWNCWLRWSIWQIWLGWLGKLGMQDTYWRSAQLGLWPYIMENVSNVSMRRNCKVTYKVKFLAYDMKCSFGNDRIVKNVSNVLILIHEKAMMKPLRFESKKTNSKYFQFSFQYFF